MASGYIPSQQDEAHRNTSKSSSSNQPMNVDKNPIKRQPEEAHEPKGRVGRPKNTQPKEEESEEEPAGIRRKTRQHKLNEEAPIKAKPKKKDRSKTIKEPPRETQEDKIFWDTFGAAMEKKY